MYCHTHTCWYTHRCPYCGYHLPWAAPAPAPVHWCAVCRRYTYTWHQHAVPMPQPVICGPSAAVVRDQQTINALAGGPRRSP